MKLEYVLLCLERLSHMQGLNCMNVYDAKQRRIWVNSGMVPG